MVASYYVFLTKHYLTNNEHPLTDFQPQGIGPFNINVYFNFLFLAQNWGI